jgi:hypothetical protein
VTVEEEVGPLLAIVGTADAEGHRDALVARVFEREVRSRCAVATVRGVTAPDAASCAEIVRDHDLVVIDAGAAGERRWREWLAQAAGAVEGAAAILVRVPDEPAARAARRWAPGADVHVVPDTVLVVDRLVPESVLARRLRYLRALDRYPPGRPLLVHAVASSVDATLRFADVVAPAVASEGDLPIAVLDPVGAGSASSMAERLSGRLDRPVSVVPVASVEDVVATIAGAAVYVGASPTGVATAIAHGVPLRIAGEAENGELLGLAELAGLTDAVIRAGASSAARVVVRSPAFHQRLGAARQRLQASIDAHFDRVVETALRSWGQRATDVALRRLARLTSRLAHEAQALREANQALRERLLEERLRFGRLLAADGRDPGPDE